MAEQPRILIAEDNRVLADVIRFNLADEGFDVTAVGHGRRALKLAHAEAFDLIISDYQMPGISGEEFLRGVRADSASRDAVCILCSAKSYELDNERLTEELGLMRIVMKPFSPSELVELAKDALLPEPVV